MCMRVRFLFWLVVAVLLLGSCATCRTVERVLVEHHDTVRQVGLRVDSVYLHDSIYSELIMVGDTLVKYKYVFRNRWRERVVRDSVYLSKVDTVVVEKESRDASRDRGVIGAVRNWLGGVALWVVIAVALWVIGRWVKKKFFL